MKVCVLQPDYTTADVDYKNYDPPRNLQHLLPDAVCNMILPGRAASCAES